MIMSEIMGLTLPMHDSFTSIPNLWPMIPLTDFVKLENKLKKITNKGKEIKQ